ncbi:MAG: glycosyltransferase involved in cell wall biosynthesis [Pseudohongiellaceae bacterium]
MRVAIPHGHIGLWDGSSRYITDVAGLFASHGHAVTVFSESCARQLPEGVASRQLQQLGDDDEFDLLYGSDLRVLPALFERSARFFYAPLDVLASSATLERWALDRCERLLRFTVPAVEILERTYAVPLRAKSLVAVYVSLDSEGLPEPLYPRPQPAQLLWVGRLIPSKNVGFLIRAAALLRTADWQLVIAGDGPDRQALERQTQQLGLQGQVEFCGHEAALGPRFDSASLFLTASRQEHYSLTLMEAYAHGLPCIGLAPDGEQIFNAIPEQIVHGRTGLVVRHERELAQAVDELLGDEERRQQMARRGWQRKQNEFTNERFWQALQGAL